MKAPRAISRSGCSSLALLLAVSLLSPARAANPAEVPPAPLQASHVPVASAPASVAASMPTSSERPAQPQATGLEHLPTMPSRLGTQSDSVGPGMLQVFVSLLVVIGVLLGIAWLLRRFGPQHIQGGPNMRIVGGLSLGGRERVLILEVGEQWIVIGAAPGRVSHLTTLPRQHPLQGEHLPLAEKNFANWLKQVMEKKHGV